MAPWQVQALTAGLIASAILVGFPIGALLIPESVANLLEKVPAKYLAGEILFLLILILALFVYWYLIIPSAMRVCVGLIRACVVIGGGVLFSPIGFLGLEALDVKYKSDFLMVVKASTVGMHSAAILASCLICAWLTAREYIKIRKMMFLRGHLTEV